MLCTAFRGNPPISEPHRQEDPKHLLSRCEWGKDDYSLQVANLPPAPPKPGQQDIFVEEPA